MIWGDSLKIHKDSKKSVLDVGTCFNLFRKLCTKITKKEREVLKH